MTVVRTGQLEKKITLLCITVYIERYHNHTTVPWEAQMVGWQPTGLAHRLPPHVVLFTQVQQ